MRRHFRTLLVGGVLLCVAPIASWPATPGLAQLRHTAWRQEQGAPVGIHALAQTPDGFLWIGTDSGLYRFDGLRFDASAGTALAVKNVAGLYADPDGDLWIGSTYGGAARLRGDVLTNYGGADGLPTGTVFAFARDHDGVLWLAATHGLARFAGNRWRPVGREQGYLGRAPEGMLLDADGNLWVSDADGEFVKRRGKAAFERTDLAHVDAAYLGPLADTHWHASPDDGEILVDSSRALWVASKDGLSRYRWIDGPRAAPTVETLVPAQGLSGGMIFAWLQDRDGNIWAAGDAGLDRFRTTRLVPQPLPQPMVRPMLLPDRNGAIWIGNNWQPTLRLAGGTPVPFPRLGELVTCGFRDADGTAWFGGMDGLRRYSVGRIDIQPLPADMLPVGDRCQALARDADGSLWMSVSQRGLFRLRDGAWARVDGKGGLPAGPALSLYRDDRQLLWLGCHLNQIAMFEGPGLRLYGAAEGLRIGSALAFAGRAGHLWAAGTEGVAELRGERFHMLHGTGGERFLGTSGVVETGAGELWLHGARGVTRIDAKEIAAFRTDAGHVVSFERFDHLDGLDGTAVQSRPVPTLIEGDDGRLWAATNRAVAWIDPQHIVRDPRPPVVRVTGLIARDEPYPLQGRPELPARTTGVELRYTAPNLTMPERLRFRYRLDGVDDDWQDAGNRREAFYTNLGPGRYRFRVAAANPDGVWSAADAVLDFSIGPAFYQTWWFRSLYGVFGFIVLWMLYLLRLRQMTLRLRARLEERYGERERIARELHDTLLQSVQGLILRFHAIAARVGDAETRRVIEDTLDRADTVLAEGRDRVRALRGLARPMVDLADAFAEVARELSGLHPATFRVFVERAARPLNPLARDEVYQLGREALFNAFQHAGAKTIELELSYGPRELALRVRDDGKGIDEGVLHDGGRPGHWGIAGMRERAARLGARFEIWSRKDSGTEIELRVPAGVAYCPRTAKAWLLRLAGRAVASDMLP